MREAPRLSRLAAGVRFGHRIATGELNLANQPKAKRTLEDQKVPVKIKLSALWATVMLCYIYNDYFSLLKPGAIEAVTSGNLPVLGVLTQPIMLAMAASVAIPAVMVYLSLALKPAISRWANIILGAAYTAIIITTMFGGAWWFYIFLDAIEASLTIVIVWTAWRWPEKPA
jgi:hypothetical protein